MEQREIIEGLRKGINEVFVGKEDVVEDVLTCFLAGGHLLIEDVPGVGKTTLALALAKSVDCSFGRIQFTPDTLPTDVTGVSIYDMKEELFRYEEGVIMHQILLADEINRTSPKTQASLLEAMAEGQVTVDGQVYELPKPFMVIATQNPVEFLGTYPLPEAQLDRFMMRLTIGYPSREQEIRLASLFLEGKTLKTLDAVCSVKEILGLKELVEAVTVKDIVLEYIEDIVEGTRKEEKFVLGASPRAMLALTRASQARAFLQGRDFVKPDDVRAMAEPVLTHRLTLSSDAKLQKLRVEQVLKNVILKVKVPM